MEPQIRYCTSADGTSIAYATAGQGSPLVLIPGWVGNVEVEWQSPEGSRFYGRLAENRQFVQYDRRGVGASQREVDDVSLEAHIRDLTAIIDDLGLKKLALCGAYDGAAVAVAYAAIFPERIAHLMLWSPYSKGNEMAEPDKSGSLADLIRKNWHLASRAISDISYPTGPIGLQRWFSDRLRASVSSEVAARYFEYFASIDVSGYAPKVKAPTLILHRRQSRVVPISAGRRMAALIPNAIFVSLDGDMGGPYFGDISHVETMIQFLDGLEVISPEPDPPADHGMIGKTISHYKILEKLGEGGMGVVYKAVDTKLRRQVALKFLPQEMTRPQEWEERFLREAQAAAALDHPNICTVYEIDEIDGDAFIAMAYIVGTSLEERISSRSFEVGEALEIAIQLAEGLQEAHRRGIIHRDIKSQNIMLDSFGRPRIMDFGLAKLTGQTRLTKTATIMGTVAYMSPEQAHGEATIDHRTDIWSLGVLIYEMLAGRQPFDAPSDAGLIHKIIYEEPEPLTRVRTDIPLALEQAIKKALQKNPQDRYEDMEALLSDLKAIRSGAAPVIVVEEKTIPSIAVLPFADMSPQKDQEYFCDGIAEEIINALTQLKDLRVIARTSAFHFKGHDIDVRDIGKKLNVGAVLEGSVRKAGSRVRVTVQLIDVVGGHHLWSEKYDRSMKDIFAIQDDISEAIIEKLKPALLGEEKAKLGRRQTIDVEAYNLFLKGRWFWSKQSEEGIRKGIEYFRDAIVRDSNFAGAYAGLAGCFAALAEYQLERPKKAFPEAKDAAEQALRIDPTLASARLTLAFIQIVYDWDWDGAEKEFRRIVELNPGYANAHMYYAHCLSVLSRFDDALAEIRKALELDPLSLFLNRMVGWVFTHAGKYDEAIEIYKNMIEMDPNYSGVRFQLGRAYLEKSMFQEALTEFEKEKSFHGPMTIALAYSGIAHARMGEKRKAYQALCDLEERSKNAYVMPSTLAMLCFAIGETDAGFEHLERAYEERSPHLCVIKINPMYDLIRSDPRYHALLRKIGLEKPDATVPMIEPSPSIAVLPFVNMSADPEQEYFCDGLAEELINALTQIRDLDVIARTSAFSFKGQDIDIRDIGKKLNAQTVLEGSVRKAGNRIRITAQLVDTSRGIHLWSDKYDRELEDIFTIQDEITRAIVDRLRPRLFEGEKKLFEKRQTVNIDAHNLYLKGRWFFNKGGEEGIRDAIRYFKNAIEKDPDYGPAHAGLSQCYSLTPIINPSSPAKEYFPKAKESATRALVLDNKLAEAHGVLAAIKSLYEWDWDEGERIYKQAIELNPGSAEAHDGYSMYLRHTGQPEKAVEEIVRAHELDPLSLVINRHVGEVFAFAGQFERATEAFRNTLELNPTFDTVHLAIGMMYFQQSRYEEAIAELEKEKELSDASNLTAEVIIGVINAILGRRDETQRLLDDLLERSKRIYIPPYFIANLYFALLEIDKGFEWFNKGCEERDFWLAFSNINGLMDFLNLRSDPRYIDILKKIGLEK